MWSEKKLLLERPQVRNFIKKETLAQVFSCEFYEISKKTFLHRPPLVTACWIRKTRWNDSEEKNHF